jgi:hypothetical protein
MRRFERVVALPDPKNVDFTQPNQQLGSSPTYVPKRLKNVAHWHTTLRRAFLNLYCAAEP